MGKQKEVLEKLAEAFQIRHVLLRQALAECLGTLILVVSMFCFASCGVLSGSFSLFFSKKKQDNRLNYHTLYKLVISST